MFYIDFGLTGIPLNYKTPTLPLVSLLLLYIQYGMVWYQGTSTVVLYVHMIIILL